MVRREVFAVKTWKSSPTEPMRISIGSPEGLIGAEVPASAKAIMPPIAPVDSTLATVLCVDFAVSFLDGESVPIPTLPEASMMKGVTDENPPEAGR